MFVLHVLHNKLRAHIMSHPAIGFNPIPGEAHYKTKDTYWKWDGKSKRKPMKGERFMSGARPIAYIARADMSSEYFICIPVNKE